jgi:hypothetical protein
MMALLRTPEFDQQKRGSAVLKNIFKSWHENDKNSRIDNSKRQTCINEYLVLPNKDMIIANVASPLKWLPSFPITCTSISNIDIYAVICDNTIHRYNTIAKSELLNPKLYFHPKTP